MYFTSPLCYAWDGQFYHDGVGAWMAKLDVCGSGISFDLAQPARSGPVIKPAWSAEAFPNLDEDVRQSIARIQASPFIPHKDQIRGFIFDVATGKLNEVS